jgi:hypothetical protein
MIINHDILIRYIQYRFAAVFVHFQQTYTRLSIPVVHICFFVTTVFFKNILK